LADGIWKKMSGQRVEERRSFDKLAQLIGDVRLHFFCGSYFTRDFFAPIYNGQYIFQIVARGEIDSAGELSSSLRRAPPHPSSQPLQS
jgi:hypothetical protein